LGVRQRRAGPSASAETRMQFSFQLETVMVPSSKDTFIERHRRDLLTSMAFVVRRLQIRAYRRAAHWK